MTAGPNGGEPTPEMIAQATQAMADVVGATTALFGCAIPCDPKLLFGLIADEMQKGPMYEQVLHDVEDATARTKHPHWGFYIAGLHPETRENVEIARTMVPKQLVMAGNPEYLAQLAAWTNTYMLAINPAARAAWRAVGFTVHFFQTAQAPGVTPAKSKLLT